MVTKRNFSGNLAHSLSICYNKEEVFYSGRATGVAQNNKRYKHDYFISKLRQLVCQIQRL